MLKTDPRRYHGSTLSHFFAEADGIAEAVAELTAADAKANAKAAKLLAARECPQDLIEFGRIHNIPTFAEYTWQAGFLAGMRAAELNKASDE